MSDAILVSESSRLPWTRRIRLWLTYDRTIAVAAIGILVIAFAARAYALRDVPRLTDETDEVMRGLAIARGEMFPLTNVDAYIGPLWNYLLAFWFFVVGPTTMLPRALTLGVAILTVGATARLAREMACRTGLGARADLIALGAALLLASSSFHAVVSSRIGWSHALTPLAVTIALILLLRWESRRDSRLFLLGGLAYGFAVHTHPTALALAPGLGLWALLHWRNTLGDRAGWGALGLFLLANLPMLAHNALTGFGSVEAAAQVQKAYAAGATAPIDGYLGNLDALLRSIPLLLAGEIGEHRGVMRSLDNPFAFVWAGLVSVGLLVTIRHRVFLPLLLFVSVALVMPLFNGKYEPLFNGRYLAPLLPLAFVLGAVAVGALVETLRCSVAWRSTMYATLAVLLCIPSVASLASYISVTATDGPHNGELYRAVAIAAAAGSSKPVLVDATISGTRASTGREGTGVLEYIMLVDTPLSVRRSQPADLIKSLERGESDLVLVSTRLLHRLDKGFVLEMPPGEDEARPRRRAPFAVARVVGQAEELPDLDIVAAEP